jgi:predicted HicB family RNase H-like nuclease
MMRHERYLAEIEFDEDEGLFHGRSINVHPGGFDFWGSTVEELRREFAASARAHEEFCHEQGIEIVVSPLAEAL